MILPVVHAAPPPAQIDETTLCEIKRVAKDVQARAKYAQAFISPARTYREKILDCANISEMSDAAFRLLYTIMRYGKDDGTNSFPGQETLAGTIRRSKRTLIRARNELEDDGWLETKRQRRGVAVAQGEIPKHVRDQIVKEILEVTDMALLKTPLDLPNFDRTPILQRQEVPKLALVKQEVPDLSPNQNQEVPNQVLRSDKSVQQEPYIEPSSSILTARARASQLLTVEDFGNHHKLLDAWGRKPSEMFPRMWLSLQVATDNLRQSVQALETRHPGKADLVLTAVRMTISSMQMRAATPEAISNGGKGASAYFQRELHGMMKFLLDEQSEKPKQQARASPISSTKEARSAQITADVDKYFG